MSTILKNDATLDDVRERYPERLSPFVRRVLDEGRYSAQAARQYIPSLHELEGAEGFSQDACNEGLYRRGKAIIHKYKNRAAMVLTNICFVYCRFCFRKAMVGQADSVVKKSDLEDALEFVRKTPEICDVLLTGGDPLSLGNGKLRSVIEGLTGIDHVKVIRVDSRALNTAPERLDDELLDIFKESGKVWYHAHLNHPDDLCQTEVMEALCRLQAVGVPVLNQFVLLRGVNDDANTIRRLLLTCYSNKVIPYNVYLPDKTEGTSHFRVDRYKIREIYEAIGELPGPAQPAIVSVDSRNLKQRALYNDHLNFEAFLDDYYGLDT